jgi:hypothetical protein
VQQCWLRLKHIAVIGVYGPKTVFELGLQPICEKVWETEKAVHFMSHQKAYFCVLRDCVHLPIHDLAFFYFPNLVINPGCCIS